MSSSEIQTLKPSLLSLPDDLLLNCFARVSRLYYPTLSLVSKRFGSLVVSPELYKVRSSLGNTESCLYVCLKFFPDDCQWFTLCRKPDQFITNDTNESRGYVLAKLPIAIPGSAPATSRSLVAVGSDIYNISGSNFLWPSSRVLVLDCTSHTWREAPSLQERLVYVYTSIVDQNLYVGGSYYDEDSYSWKKVVEVLDTKTQIWDHVPIPTHELGDCFTGIACIDGKLHLMGERNEAVAYNSEEGRWDSVGPQMGHYRSHESYCEIENVLYSGVRRKLQWYDTKQRKWKEVKGLLGLPKFPSNASLNLIDYGGKMAVFWTKDFREKAMIWCAEISLEKLNNSCEIWGKVEWFGHVLTKPTICWIVKVLAPTV